MPADPVQFSSLPAFFGVTKQAFMAEWLTMGYVARCELVRDVALATSHDPVMVTGADVYSMARATGLG